MKVGAPIETKGLTPADRERLMRQVREAIIQMNLELGGLGGERDALAHEAREPEGRITRKAG